MSDEPAGPAGPPLMFISSFSGTGDGGERGGGDVLEELREDLWDLNKSSLRNESPATTGRPLTWVAEKSEPWLGAEPDKLKVIDRLIQVLRESAFYVCILAGRRRGSDEHGTAVPYGGEATAVSYFEIELYAAAMYNKPVLLYVLGDFDPGPRLDRLLQILKWAIPDWRELTPMRPAEILDGIREEIRRQAFSAVERRSPLRRRLVDALWRARSGPAVPSRRRPGVLFLGGASEDRALPEPGRVELLIREYRRTPNYQQKLNRIWLAARELMPASYHPEAVRHRPALAKFLPYWDGVLGDWAAAASWHGWHGHLYAGTIAPLNSQALLRSQAAPENEECSPEVKLPPDGAMASAYYSLGGILGFGPSGWECLWRAGRHVQRAIEARSGPTDNLLAIRGSVRLRMGWWPGAISDFSKMLRLREANDAPPQKIADALMHLGTAYALCPLLSKGTDLLHKSVDVLSANPHDPNLSRAKRKLAFAYGLRGDRTLAERYRREAEADAQRVAADDQIRD